MTKRNNDYQVPCCQMSLGTRVSSLELRYILMWCASLELICHVSAEVHMINHVVKSWWKLYQKLDTYSWTYPKLLQNTFNTFANTFEAFQLVQRLNTLIPCTFPPLNFHRSNNKCIEFISTDSLYIFIPASVTARTSHKKSFQNFITGRLYTVEQKGEFSAYTVTLWQLHFIRIASSDFFFGWHILTKFWATKIRKKFLVFFYFNCKRKKYLGEKISPHFNTIFSLV